MKNRSVALEAVYDVSLDAILVIDSGGSIIMANRRVEEMFGYSKEELIGQPVECLIPSRYKKSHKEYRTNYGKNPTARSVSNGYVLTARRKDGTEFHVDISLKPISVGNEKYVASFVRELSTNKTMELRFQKMIEDVQDYSIVFTDIDGTIINWNKGVSRISGYSEEEIIGKNFRVFYTEFDQENEEPERLLDRAIVDGRAQEEGWRVRKDGSIFWASETITAIHDDLHHFIGFSKVTRDLTESKKAEELLRKQSAELEAKNKELEHFAYIASHDLKEPLSTVTSMIELIRDEKNDQFDEECEVYFTFIEDAIDRMSQLVSGLLDYSRLGKNGELHEVDVSNVLKDVLNDLGTSIKSKKAHVELLGDFPVVTAFPVELRLLFQNIISNALKFIPEERDPHIVVKFHDQGSYWKFSVKDNGIGIPKQYLDKIFIIFQRLNDRSAYEGTGIGLAHCKKIIELHNGSIWVDSIEGVGSTFYFTINKSLDPKVDHSEIVKTVGTLDKIKSEILPILNI